jgi:transcriptional regulator GlxA family with amidase domain
MTTLLKSFCISIAFLFLLVTGLAEPAKTSPGPPLVVDILLFDGAETIDFSGPWEVFGEAGYKVCTVAERRELVAATFGEKVMPDYTFADAPKPDILLIPGGNLGRKLFDDASLIKWIRENASSSRSVVSVCTGAFLLAKAGLLDGLTATTYHHAIDDLRRAVPSAKVVSDQRFVDNGKVLTTAGLSSGIDGALHLVEKYDGLTAAENVARNMEYDWNPRFK